MLRTLLVLLLLTVTGPALAETRYVTDQLVVSLRQAQDDRSEPLDRLATGMAVEVLADLGSYVKVKTASGATGYVRAQYLVPQPPKAGAGQGALREQLAAEQQKNADLTAELAALKSTPLAGDAALRSELELARKEVAELTSRVQGQPETAVLKREHAEQRQEIARLTSELDKARARSNSGEGGRSLSWFFAGAGVFLVGWLAGKSSRPKRRF